MKEKIHIGKLIRERLNENGQSASWLARKVHCDCSNFNKILRKDHIDTQLLLHISEVMNINFFDYYSDWLFNQKQHEK
jgi:hypothetical protein